MGIITRNKEDETIIYSDINTDLGSYNLSLNFEAVLGSLINLLTTLPGERLNRPTYGTNLEELLFSPMDDITASTIYAQIQNSIEIWEPRIKLNNRSSSVVPNYDTQTYEVTLYFYVVGLNVEFKLHRYYRHKDSVSKE